MYINNRPLISGRRGYTLIEVLVVMGILAITARGVIFLFSGFLEQRSLTDETNELASTFRNASVRAASGENNQSWGVHLINNVTNPDEYVLFSGPAYAGGTVFTHVKLSTRIQFSDPTSGNSKDIIFTQLTGAPSAASSVTVQLVKDGNVTRQVSVNALGLVTVANGSVAAATISITAPLDSASVFGTITYSASASDPSGVAGVQFKLDGANLGSEDTTAASNGAHTLTAVLRSVSNGNTTSAGVNSVVSNGLVAAYALNEGTGATAADISGNARTATLNGPTWQTSNCEAGNCINYTTNSTQVTTFAATSLPTDHTLMSWIKFPIPINGDWRTLFAHNGGNYHYILVQSGANILGVYNAGWYACGYDVSTVPSGWHNLAAVGTGSNTTFYLDGSQICVSSTKISGQDVGAIGNYQAGATQSIGTSIDEIRIYNRALSAAEIIAAMNTPL